VKERVENNMGTPTIGTAVTPVQEEKKKIIKELTILEDNAKESIHYLIFTQEEKAQQV
jgi:hypothetical protein